MLRNTTNFIIALSFPTLISGCLKKTASQPLSTPNLKIQEHYKPRISKNWHTYFQKKVANDSSIKKAWALFSYGGWSNTGQVMVYDIGTSILVEVAAPGLKSSELDKLETRVLTKDLNHLKEFSGLESIDEVVFDTLNYEYVVVDKGETSVYHVFMRAADFNKHKNHFKLIESMNSLKDNTKLKK